MPECKTTTFRGRRAVRLKSDAIEVVALAGCGHVARMSLAGLDLNPLWEPPWPSIEPEAWDPAKHAAQYGPVEGRLLSAIMGHNLCLNQFGDITEAEAEAGGYFHGEASNLPWEVFEQSGGREGAKLAYGLTMPDAGMKFRREIEVKPGEPTVYFTERVENLRRVDSPLFCQQHVTIGPPFLEAGVTFADFPGTRARTFPVSLGEHDHFRAGVDFEWPKAPGRVGELDIRVFGPRDPMLSICSVLLEPKEGPAYVAASNPKRGLMMLYVFPHEAYPWMALWHENHGSQEKPWNGKTQSWGLEFGTVPFPVKQIETLQAGPLWGKPRFATLPARKALEVRYLAQLHKIPADWKGVEKIHIDGGRVTVHERGSGRTVHAPAAPHLRRSV